MLWSILIAGIPERYHSAAPLLRSLLETQSVARMPDVELIYLLDNRRRSVGTKRNDLLAAARGEYISFVDDDDLVSPDYVQKIYRAIVATRKSDAPADVLCFGQRATLAPHGITHECTYSLKYWREREPDKRRVLEPLLDANGQAQPTALKWTGPPAHTMAWRAGIAKAVAFHEKQFGEDSAWVDKCCELAVHEVQIPDCLYFYKFDEARSMTR